MDEAVYRRTYGLVPPLTRQLKVLMVGAGMVGSWTTAVLARMVRHVVVVDFDTIEMHNVGVQLYSPLDVGKKKVEVLANDICEGMIVSGLDMTIEDYARENPVMFGDEFDVIVSGVDSMAVRAWLFAQVKANETPLFIDVRMLGEIAAVLTVIGNDFDSQDAYEDTLLGDDEVDEVPCGAEGTVYSGAFAASRVASTINNWARGLDIRPKEVWHTGLMELIDSHMNEGGISGTSQEGQEEPDQEDTSDSDWQADEASREAAILEADRREEVESSVKADSGDKDLDHILEEQGLV